MVGGLERDLIFEQDHLIHYVECTLDRKLEKVKRDVKKLTDFRQKKERPERRVMLWEITREDPTADQREHARKHNVAIMSLDEFKRQVIDGTGYLQSRATYRFGSATDPKREDSDDTSNLKWQPVSIRREGASTPLALRDVTNALVAGSFVGLLGDFGMGKSLLIRELFRDLRARYEDKSFDKIPLVLNLREHWGQNFAAEALMRHAMLIGFEKPQQLVRALFAGRLVVLLDGFDEVIATPWTPRRDRRLREIRRDALRLVSELADSCRGRCGFLVAGREHFFDSRDELLADTGLRKTDWLVHVDPFSEAEAAQFLAGQGFMGKVPEWLPKRPLLLANLIARGQVDALLLSGSQSEPAKAWDTLVDNICRREAKIHQQQLDAASIRRVLEELASSARATTDGLGPLADDHIAEAFRKVVGSYPDEGGRALLHRLPGLSVRDPQNGSRSFIDDQMLDVLRAGAVERFVAAPYTDPDAESWKNGIQGLGASLVWDRWLEANSEGFSVKPLVVAATQAQARWKAPTLALDVVQVAKCGSTPGPVGFSDLTIEGGDLGPLDLGSDPALQNLRIVGCSIKELELPATAGTAIEITDSLIHRVVGCAGTAALPAWIRSCLVGEYDVLNTSAALLGAHSMPLRRRVLLTMLRKLFLQPGNGRVEGALYRGMDQKAQAEVPPLLNTLEKHGFAFPIRHRGSVIWHAVSGYRQRALRILEDPSGSTDTIFVSIQ
jgi:hypothetical protein